MQPIQTQVPAMEFMLVCYNDEKHWESLPGREQERIVGDCVAYAETHPVMFCDVDVHMGYFVIQRCGAKKLAPLSRAWTMFSTDARYSWKA